MQKVQKRDGSIENYDEGKIFKVAIATGLNENQAKTVASSITQNIRRLNEGTITSLQIRDFMITELKKYDHGATDLYVWYEQTKDGK